MLGNDVIDLDDRDADAATYSPRWPKRVFTGCETDLVATAADPERMRWSIWAAKEAAYKCARQMDPSAIFSPRAFEVALAASVSRRGSGDRRGHVDWRGERLPLFIEEGERWLHARVDAAPATAPPLRLGVAVVPGELVAVADGPSRFVRLCVIRDAAAGPLRGATLPGDLPDDLEIVRHGRIPVLHSRRGRESESLSLSHHGRFVAWAWRPAEGVACAGATVPKSNDSMNGVFA